MHRRERDREELFNALVWFRLALSSQVDFGPYENDPGARAAYRDGDFYRVGDLEDFLRLTDTHVARDSPKTHRGSLSD